MSIERKLIARLSTPEEMNQAWDLGLRANVFEDPINQAIFNHIVQYWQDAAATAVPTRTVLEHDFPGVHFPEEVEESMHWLINTLQDRYVRNEAQDLMMEAAETLEDDPRASLSRLHQAAYAASELVAPRVNRSDMSNYEERRQRYSALLDVGQGATYGVPEIDEHTQGCADGELAVIGGFAKTGKTFWGVNAAVLARRQGFQPIFFTLEMAKEEVEDRIDAFWSGVSYDRLSKHRLETEEIRRYHQAQEELADIGRIFVEKPERGERSVRNLLTRARTLGANYVIIDQLSFMDAAVGSKSKDLKGRHSEIVFDLKDEINRESAGKLPCLLNVQFNRKSQERGGRPSMENFANASEIEQTCDIAFGLWRDPEMRSNAAMQVDIMGSRRCDNLSWMLNWELKDKSEISMMHVIGEDD